MPEIHASYGWSAERSGSTLRMWQQRSGSRSHRFAPSARCCSAIVGISGWMSCNAYRSTRRSRVSYDSRKKRCVSSSTVSMRSPSPATMCTRTDDCFCHEHVRQTRGQNVWWAHAISSSAVMASKSRSGSRGGLSAGVATCASSPCSRLAPGRKEGARGRPGVTLAQEHLSQGVAAEPEPEGLERDDLLGRDVPEVHLGAEVRDEPRLRGLRRRLPDEVLEADGVLDLVHETRAELARGAVDARRAALATLG